MCHKAGIKVKTISGDNIVTALAILKDSNIKNEDQFNEALEDIDKFRDICNSIIRPKRNYSSNNILNKDPSNNIRNKILDDIAKSDFDSQIPLEGKQFSLLSGNHTKN